MRRHIFGDFVLYIVWINLNPKFESCDICFIQTGLNVAEIYMANIDQQVYIRRVLYQLPRTPSKENIIGKSVPFFFKLRKRFGLRN